MLPDFLSVPRERLGEGHAVAVSIVPDAAALAEVMARDMLAEIAAARTAGRNPTLIVPVGPVDQFPILARLINAERVSLADCMFINMDEYLTEGAAWVDEEHPLSFRGYMRRAFYDLVDAELAPPRDMRVFPDPRRPERMAKIIAERGGVDACFGGIGINAHVAFNEPPEPGVSMTVEEFAALPSRVLPLARETRTINSVTVGGEISIIPKLAVTVGMREILASRRLRLYCNRPWQAAVARRVLRGPITPAAPASLARTHPDATLTLTEQVATPPDIRLR